MPSLVFQEALATFSQKLRTEAEEMAKCNELRKRATLALLTGDVSILWSTDSLSNAEETNVQAVWNLLGQGQPVETPSGISPNKLGSLRPGEWINGEILDTLTEWMQAHIDKLKLPGRNLHFGNTSLYDCLELGKSSTVSKWFSDKLENSEKGTSHMFLIVAGNCDNSHWVTTLLACGPNGNCKGSLLIYTYIYIYISICIYFFLYGYFSFI